jgi:hypothetical protein
MRVTISPRPVPLTVIEKPLPPLSSMPGNLEFTPIRLVANIAVVQVENPAVTVTKFDPPIEIDVAYLAPELFEALRLTKPLKLAYWDGGAWVVFTQAAHQYELLSPVDGAVGKVIIAEWAGDPPIAWGT